MSPVCREAAPTAEGRPIPEVIRRSTAYLERHGVESARANVEALLMHLLGTGRTGLYARVEALDPSTAGRLGRMLCRRCGGVPLQHLTGEQQFLDLVLAVEPGVFVPRPETEGLALAAIEAVAGVAAPLVVDVGTGTGAVALAVKSRRPDARVLATDRSASAVGLARANAARLGLAVEVMRGDLLEPVPADLRGRLDLLVSNPPYVARDVVASLPADVRADPLDALAAGEGGMAVLGRLAEVAPGWLRPGGVLALEIGETQAAAVVRAIAAARQGAVAEVLPDLAGRDRVVLARMPGPSSRGRVAGPSREGS